MPTHFSDGTPLPTLTASIFDARLDEIAGRPLTPAEKERRDQMIRHNCNLRVIAEDLFGTAHVAPHFLPKETYAAEESALQAAGYQLRRLIDPDAVEDD
jgi:hypothetical protein